MHSYGGRVRSLVTLGSLGRHAIDAAATQRGFGRTVSSFLAEQVRSPARYRVSEPELARRAAAYILDARFTVGHGGHAPWLDDPAAVAEPVRAFIA